ncbi:MAG TPA: TlpA disulfide reductase family protein, partial [Bacteroidia bacterium]|nr:TlpA disulfide reductase family protein [Bacteroidia bacterium]
DFEHAQLNLYKQYRDSIVPDMETDYLLRGNIQSAILRAKQEFLSNFETKEIDSLNLINKLGLDINNLLDDTILIKHPSFNLYMYLNAYQNMHIDSRVSHNDDFNSYMRSAVNLIDTEKKYSKEIKSHLLSNLIYHFMMVAGPTPLTDSITDQLSARKKISIDGINALTDIRKEYEHLMPGKPAPYLQGISTDGRVIAISDFKGKVVFVDIWATWCKPCIEALPHILKLQNSFKNNNEVLFIFLSNDSRENGDENWKKYLEAHPEFKGQHLRARKEEDRPLEEAWKVTGIPRYMLIDKKGNIIDAFVKNHSFEEIQLMIERALQEQ